MKKLLLSVLSILIPVLSASAQVYDYVVAKDGSGDFTTINEAINAVNNVTVRKTIFIKNGVYEEKVFIGTRYTEVDKIISLIGENADSVIITWSDYNGKSITYPGKGTITADGMTCPTLTVTSPDFYMENITVSNPSTTAQAVALYQTRDRQTLKNCRIIGNQDTHRTKKGRRYFYYNTLIEGGVDFIYAGGTCYFYKCNINSNRNGYITAPEDVTYMATLSTGKTLRYGFFFKDCDLTAGIDVAAGSVYLGRPWQKECGSAFLNCRLGNHINTKGWMEMSGNESSACFAEYQSMNANGTALSDVSKRVSWSMQLNTEDVNKYMMLSTIYAAVSSTPYDPVSMVIAPRPVSNVSNNGSEITWNAVEEAKGYVVYADNKLLGFATTNSYHDSSIYKKAPVYNVRTVGPYGNLSVKNGDEDNVTVASINAVINSPVTNLISLKNEVHTPVVKDGFLFFSEPTDFTLFTISGLKVMTCHNLMSCSLATLPVGVYLVNAKDMANGYYSTKIKR